MHANRQCLVKVMCACSMDIERLPPLLNSQYQYWMARSQDTGSFDWHSVPISWGSTRAIGCSNPWI